MTQPQSAVTRARSTERSMSMIDDALGAETQGLLIHLDSTNKALPGSNSRQRAFMYASLVGVGGAMVLLEEGDVEAAREQLLATARIQIEWVREDFEVSYPLWQYLSRGELAALREAFLKARCDYYVDEETGEVKFDDPTLAANDKPADPDDFVGATCRD